MRFTKMHGIGNDYIYVDAFRNNVRDPAGLAVRISDRHFGVGSDGLVLIGPSDRADFRMRMFNSDGSEGEMCGNAARCIGKYVYDRGLTDRTEVTLETRAGIKTLTLRPENGQIASVRVDMGEPVLEAARIPLLPADTDPRRFTLEAGGQSFTVSAVSMGNPHCVIPVEDIAACGFEAFGPLLEKHPRFPAHANIEFTKVLDRGHVRVRVWERGSGETLACGTGACAVAVACARLGLTDRACEVQLRGGTLHILWAENNHVYQEGPAAFICDGEWPEDA